MAPVTVTKRERGCGFRSPGGNYIMGGAWPTPCDRLPMPIPVCATCGTTIEFFRGAKKINPRDLFKVHPEVRDQINFCSCTPACPVCYPPIKGWVMWVGEQFYTIESFMSEARSQGLSKRIAQFPKEMAPGDYLYLAYKKGYQERGTEDWKPVIFTASIISRFEHVLTDKQKENPEYIANLESKGVVPVIEVDPV